MSGSRPTPHPGYNVIVICGGPAGATAGAYLARRKLRVLILDKEHFSRPGKSGRRPHGSAVRIGVATALIPVPLRDSAVFDIASTIPSIR
jgi:flavin-dependent dehydrogenase